MIYLYGITEKRGDVPTAARGLDGAPLQSVTVESLRAVCSVHDQLEPRPDVESCWAHERVVEALMQACTVLPARFGTTFDDAADLELALVPRADALSEQLARVRGCVELAVRIRPAGEATAQPGGDGRSYLQNRLLEQRRAEATIDGTLAALAEIAVSAMLWATSSASGTASVSYLVRRSDVGRFCAQSRRIQRQHPHLALSCTGPWAPYSFSSTATA